MDKQHEGKNYLITNEEDLNDSDEDNVKETCSSSNREKLPNPLGEKLPRPDLSNVSEASVSKVTDGPGSVFSNPFENAELAKQSILEKHVKMTEAHLLTGKKAKICKSFKLGKCRFGKHCKYSHDLDSNLSLKYTNIQDEGRSESYQNSSQSTVNPNYPRLPPPPKGFMGTVDTLIHSGPHQNLSAQQRKQYSEQVRYMQDADAEDDDKFNVGDKRKKRVGVSQSLVPPKKAMSSLTKQRREERPWTVKRK